ncbi:TPA: phosphatidate cytidylyltransferase [Yersinia enterocolitica]|uniref:Phosphatidate cytidylyltransferase n=1 Tax=Yersinia enterocolitica TaxID=630 RepID=A0A7T9XVF5_YEREN|nr:phosphatidate cytidylyltransferase [Yersinia enterocolitica]EHB20135.1 CDP-diglyceride synthase [Yersinia enterocolitica subsp. palearctica PhRBD_Ye1]EKN3314829.1 phosphatidate cytidylyltransferase [Yersinia enterocolitica]EKN3318695.1 phosphatidate cytidylyltransferase [Yersinia enterocolitica]EKN3322645.1 phosphatidate cytidylyltransferase [Yersinia enterocolitica]EKN3334515.1 phosphatidate cytidylyltransferase [Yersinia enterocolitica]
MLKYRLITALILIPVVIGALFLLPPVGFAIVTLVVCMLAAWEWGQLAGFASRSQRIWLAILCGFLLISMLLSLPAYQHSAHLPQVSVPLWLSMGWWIAALLLVLTYPRSAAVWRNSHLLRIIFGILTIVPFFWGMVALRQYGYEQDHNIGAWWLLYVMLLVWGADSGAYMFGKLFGKHKLAPKVSPGKTWEGLIGGLLTSALISWLFGRYAPLDIIPEILLICSVAAALASVLGDLTESMFKREAGIKDSGHLIPGHGGILDRIDSLTAAVPVFACLMLLVF